MSHALKTIQKVLKAEGSDRQRLMDQTNAELAKFYSHPGNNAEPCKDTQYKCFFHVTRV